MSNHKRRKKQQDSFSSVSLHYIYIYRSIWCQKMITTKNKRMKSISKAISEGKGQSEVTKAYKKVMA